MPLGIGDTPVKLTAVPRVRVILVVELGGSSVDRVAEHLNVERVLVVVRVCPRGVVVVAAPAVDTLARVHEIGRPQIGVLHTLGCRIGSQTTGLVHVPTLERWASGASQRRRGGGHADGQDRGCTDRSHPLLEIIHSTILTGADEESPRQ